MPDIRVRVRTRSSAWLRHWGPLLPLMVAMSIVMLGFGAMIPVLSLYVQSQGISPASIGIIISGWAVGRLLSEPPFGWWADRHSRKPQMVISLMLVGVTSLLMLVFTSAAELFARTPEADRPSDLAGVDALVEPVVQAAVEREVPPESDSLISAVR